WKILGVRIILGARIRVSPCFKCNRSIVGDCLTALDRKWHPECFCCAHCHKPFGNSCFFLEDGNPYCEQDWNTLFTTKCCACQFPIEAGDRWVEALGNAYHSNCFTCTVSGYFTIFPTHAHRTSENLHCEMKHAPLHELSITKRVQKLLSKHVNHTKERDEHSVNNFE
ncbi:putative LIM domain protein, partial [Trichinella spiralis]|uniref:putative LIM domain protein n=1 Tax=Trichinella spiralis TaxID=6334 RepID=UPI0001EFEDC3